MHQSRYDKCWLCCDGPLWGTASICVGAAQQRSSPAQPSPDQQHQQLVTFSVLNGVVFSMVYRNGNGNGNAGQNEEKCDLCVEV